MHRYSSCSVAQACFGNASDQIAQELNLVFGDAQTFFFAAPRQYGRINVVRLRESNIAQVRYVFIVYRLMRPTIELRSCLRYAPGVRAAALESMVALHIIEPEGQHVKHREVRGSLRLTLTERAGSQHSKQNRCRRPSISSVFSSPSTLSTGSKRNDGISSP